MPEGLAERIRRLEQRVAQLQRRLLSQLAFLLAGCAAYAFVGRSVERLPLLGQAAVLALVCLPLLWLVVVLTRAPDDTLALFRPHGLWAPLFFVAGVWLAAIGWCAALGYVLATRGVIAFTTPAGDPVAAPGQIADLLVWHSFDQIPALAVNDTLQWDAPLQYASGAGVLVLGFKIAILLPLVPVFAAAFRHRPAPRQAASP